MLMSTEGRAEGGGRQRQCEAGLLQAWPEGPRKGEHLGLHSLLHSRFHAFAH